MDKIELQVETVCLVSMLAGILITAIPQGKMKGAFSSFCAVVVIFYMLTPFSQIDIQKMKAFSLDSEDKSEELLSETRTAEVMISENILEKAMEEKA